MRILEREGVIYFYFVKSIVEADSEKNTLRKIAENGSKFSVWKGAVSEYPGVTLSIDVW